MAEVIKVYRQKVPAVRFIGKQYSDGSHWGEWFMNDWFTVVEKAMGEGASVREIYEDGDAYLGLSRVKEGEPFEYWIGEFVLPGTPVPEDFLHLDIPSASLGVCWIYGKEEEVHSMISQCPQSLTQAGLQIATDEKGAVWSFERCTCPRFTTPDDKGNIILDYCYFVK